MQDSRVWLAGLYGFMCRSLGFGVQPQPRLNLKGNPISHFVKGVSVRMDFYAAVAIVLYQE